MVTEQVRTDEAVEQAEADEEVIPEETAGMRDGTETGRSVTAEEAVTEEMTTEEEEDKKISF